MERVWVVQPPVAHDHCGRCLVAVLVAVRPRPQRSADAYTGVSTCGTAAWRIPGSRSGQYHNPLVVGFELHSPTIYRGNSATTAPPDACSRPARLIVKAASGKVRSLPRKGNVDDQSRNDQAEAARYSNSTVYRSLCGRLPNMIRAGTHRITGIDG